LSRLRPRFRALLETEPQGDATIPVELPAEIETLLTALIVSPEVSAALGRLYLAGVTTGEVSAAWTAG